MKLKDENKLTDGELEQVAGGNSNNFRVCHGDRQTPDPLRRHHLHRLPFHRGGGARGSHLRDPMHRSPGCHVQRRLQRKRQHNHFLYRSQGGWHAG